MLDVIGAIWEKKCGTFWDQNHTCLSANKVEKMLDFIGAFWEKILKMLDHLEHLLGSKSHLNIGLNTIGTYWERKNRLSRGGGLDHLWHIWDPNHTWLSVKKSNNARNDRRVLRRKTTYGGELGWASLAPFDQNYKWFLAKKVEKMMDFIG